MPKQIAPLSAKQCAAAPPGKHFDGKGLFLEVSAGSGAKYWYMKYRDAAGKEKRLGIGPYPAVNLTEARAARDRAKALLREGHDPQQQREVERQRAQVSSVTTYEGIARELHERNPLGWQAAHAQKWLAMQARHLFPRIGALPVRQIDAPTLLAPLMVVENRGLFETALSLKQYASQVLRYATATGRADRDVSIDLRGAIRAPIQKSYGAITDVERLPELVRAIDGYHGRSLTREALLLALLVFQRPGNLRGLQWEWVDLDRQIITIPSSEMKRTARAKVAGKPHIVPLSAQAIECLRRIESMTGTGRFVFPSERTVDRPMSDGTLNAALRRLGFSKNEATAHGFRATARTVLAEHHDIPEAVLEELLGHGKPGPLGSAYDRATWDKQRKAAMATWGAYLEELAKPKPAKGRQAAKVVRMAAAAR